MDPERLLQTCNDDWRRNLLRAAASEVAPESVTSRVLGALEAQVPGNAPTSAPAPRAEGAALIGPQKLTVLLVAAAVAAASVYWLGLRDQRPAPEAAAAPQPPSAPVAVATQEPEAPMAPMPDDQPLAQADPGSAPPAASPAALPTQAPRRRAASAGDALSRELRLLKAVRARVQDRDAAAALSLLERYRREFPRGVLKPEAEDLQRRARELASGEK